jgi:FkbM family methyltransferase
MIKKIKIVIGNIIESSLISWILKKLIYKKKIIFKNCIINIINVDRINLVRLLFGYYESAEARLLKKYFISDLDFIDIGAGIGVMSSYYSKNNPKHKKIICVEAIKNNVPIIKKNLEENKVRNFYLENKIFLSYKSKIKKFQINKDFTASKLINSKESINTNNYCNFNYLKNKYKLTEFQSLIDIEGEELNFKNQDFKFLYKSKKLIIELHTKNRILINKFIKKLNLISKLNLIEKDGNAYYFSR